MADREDGVSKAQRKVYIKHWTKFFGFFEYGKDIQF